MVHCIAELKTSPKTEDRIQHKHNLTNPCRPKALADPSFAIRSLFHHAACPPVSSILQRQQQFAPGPGARYFRRHLQKRRRRGGELWQWLVRMALYHFVWNCRIEISRNCRIEISLFVIHVDVLFFESSTISIGEIPQFIRSHPHPHPLYSSN